MAAYASRVEWLSNQPTNDSWPEWQAYGIDQGWHDGPPTG